MVAVSLSALGGAGWQFLDNNGVILSGGKLYAYDAGGTTPTDTYQTSAGASNAKNTNPIILDSAGRPPAEIWLITTQNYKFVLKTSADASIRTYDNVPGIAKAADLADFVADLAASNGASLVGFIQTGASAVATDLLAKERQTYSVFDNLTEAQQLDVTSGAGALDLSTALNSALTDYAGHIIKFPEGAYKTNRLTPLANTTIILEPGTVITCINGGSNVFMINAANVNIWAYGAQTVMNGTQTSHNVLFDYPAANCSVRGLYAIGSGGSGDDCFYIGGDPANNHIPSDCKLIDCKGQGLGASTRNVVSMVACNGWSLIDCEFWGATGSPGAGIDLEANLYMTDGTNPLKRGLIQRCKVHNNDSGITGVFFDDVVLDNNEIYSNNGDGIGTATGGTQFNTGVFRAGDMLGVGTFTLADGYMTVSSGALLTDDYGIRIGTVLQRLTRNGATWPVAFTLSNYIVNEISADQLSFKVGPEFDYGTITSFAADGVGTKSTDPLTSDFYFHVFREGQNSNLTIRGNNKLYGNGTANGQIKLAQGVNYVVEENTCATTHVGINITLSQSVKAFRNRLTSTRNATAYRGLNIGTCSYVETGSNVMIGFGGEALRVTGSKAVSKGDRIINCGHVSPLRATYFDQGTGLRIGQITIANDLAHPSTYGLFLDATSTNAVIDEANCKTAGSSNANSISLQGTTNRVINSIVNDGTFYGTGSATYDPASLLDGEGVTTTVTVTGAALGDYARVSFSLNLQGITLTAYVSAANTVSVRFQNETGGTIDLGSGTLRAEIMKRG